MGTIRRIFFVARAILDSHQSADQAVPTFAAVSDNSKAADGGALPQGECVMCKVSIYKDRGDKWRARVIDLETRKIIRSYVYPTEGEARNDVPRLERLHRRPVGMLVSKALDAYREHLATRGNRRNRPNRPRTIEVTISRLVGLFKPVQDLLTGELTQKKVREIWAACAAGKAVDTNLNCLSQAKTFIAWLSKMGWVRIENLLEGIEVLGSRRKGKPQLGEDESKCFLACALREARTGDSGAVAAACALLLGLRASEIAERIVRDLDAGGTKLLITAAKTQAGIRSMKVPLILQPLLKRLASRRPFDARLFGKVDRFWVRYHVRRICRLAGVPVVPPHGLRGTHARLAVKAGMTGEEVARSLGHESFEVTEQHYAGRDAVDEARADRVEDALATPPANDNGVPPPSNENGAADDVSAASPHEQEPDPSDGDPK